MRKHIHAGDVRIYSMSVVRMKVDSVWLNTPLCGKKNRIWLYWLTHRYDIGGTMYLRLINALALPRKRLSLQCSILTVKLKPHTHALTHFTSTPADVLNCLKERRHSKAQWMKIAAIGPVQSGEYQYSRHWCASDC